jgi:hypothetical protein
MTLKKISIYSFLAFTFLIQSCGETPAEVVDKTETTQEQVEEMPADVENDEVAVEEETVWGVYEGYLGLYEQHVIMELFITGERVTGNYFYAKHQKLLELKGTFDSETNTITLEESYKGKPTGHLEFTASRGEIDGKWMKKKGAKEQENFKANLVAIDKDEFSSVRNRYEDTHEISIYNGTDEDIEEVTNVLTINKIGDKFFSFYYSVIGANAHIGSVEGFGEIGKDGLGVFSGEDNCVLEFTFSKNTVEVHETDCQYYRGARAYFEGILTKVK